MRSLLVLFLFTQVAFAADTCKKIDDCVDLVSKLTGTKYIYGTDLKKDDVIFPSPIELTADNADTLFSEGLNMAGYTRIPTPVEKVVKIIPARDIRYTGDLPKYNASKGNLPEIPKHNDYVMLVYKGTLGGMVSHIARNLRPFMSRYGRVIDMENSQMLIISDTAANIRGYLPIITEADVPMTKENRVKIEERMKKEFEARNTTPPTAPAVKQ